MAPSWKFIRVSFHKACRSEASGAELSQENRKSVLYCQSPASSWYRKSWRSKVTYSTSPCSSVRRMVRGSSQ